MTARLLPTQLVMGMVGARGLKRSISFSWGRGQGQPEGDPQTAVVA